MYKLLGITTYTAMYRNPANLLTNNALYLSANQGRLLWNLAPEPEHYILVPLQASEFF